MEPKKKRIRSPNFPIISLEYGLELIRTIYKEYAKYPIALPVLSKALDIAKGSYLAQHISALSQYDLINVEGEKDGRKISVSDLAYKIIIDNRPISQDRDGLIKKAALTPPMFCKLYEKYPSGLPSDDYAIEYELKVEFGFNPNAIKSFINVFKSTMEFAKIYFSGKVAENNLNIKEPDMNRLNDASIDNNKNFPEILPDHSDSEANKDESPKFINNLPESFPITLKDKKKAVLSFSRLPIKRADIELIKKFLDLMADNWADDESQN